MRRERRSKACRPIALEQHVDVLRGSRIAVVDHGDPADELELHAASSSKRPHGAEGHVDRRQIGVHGSGESAKAGEHVRGGVHDAQPSIGRAVERCAILGTFRRTPGRALDPARSDAHIAAHGRTGEARATYEDLCAVPGHLVAELIHGTLVTQPAPGRAACSRRLGAWHRAGRPVSSWQRGRPGRMGHPRRTRAASSWRPRSRAGPRGMAPRADARRDHDGRVRAGARTGSARFSPRPPKRPIARTRCRCTRSRRSVTSGSSIRSRAHWRPTDSKASAGHCSATWRDDARRARRALRRHRARARRAVGSLDQRARFFTNAGRGRKSTGRREDGKTRDFV